MVDSVREAQFRIDQAKGRQVEVGTVLEHLHATINEAVGAVELWREASAGRLPLRAFEGSKVGVIGVDRAGPSRRAARQHLQGWTGWGSSQPAGSGGGAGETPRYG